MQPACKVTIEYFAPPAHLRPYCSTFFLSEIEVAGGETVEDYLFPEWAAFRFCSDPTPPNATIPAIAVLRSGHQIRNVRFAVLGPRSQEIRFRVGTTRIWSINLSPLGWTHYIRHSAHAFANAMLDGMDHHAFAEFRPLAQTIFDGARDPPAELGRIIGFLSRLERPVVTDGKRIEDIFVKMLDPQITSVAELARSLGMNRRTLERICLRSFGFSPKLLLRRQRFLRSLTDYMLDPSLKWVGVLDGLYHDQAQFVRDFREFMGMTPSEYAALEKPIMAAVTRERVRYARDLVREVRAEGDMREYGLRA